MRLNIHGKWGNLSGSSGSSGSSAWSGGAAAALAGGPTQRSAAGTPRPPQHSTSPDSRIPHVCQSPRATAANAPGGASD